MTRFPIKVGYDHQIFLRQRRGGISRYFSELIAAYQGDKSLDVSPVFQQRLSVNQHLTAIVSRQRDMSAVPARLQPTVARLDRKLTSKRSVNVVHHTYYDPWIAPGVSRWNQAASVTTVHDMIPELLPALFPQGNPHGEKLRYVQESDVAICVSHATRDDLMQVYPDCPTPLVVVEHGCSGRFSLPSRRPAWAPAAYVLYVGDRRGYKDFDVLAAACARSGLRLPVVCAGGGPLTWSEKAMLEEVGLPPTAMLQRDVSDAELVGLYQHAAMFVYPSRHEGFGLPVLEALNAGCPTILADTAVFREIADEAAVFFPAMDVVALAWAMQQIVADADLRTDLTTQGRKRAAKYTWHRTTKLTAELYRQVA